MRHLRGSAKLRESPSTSPPCARVHAQEPVPVRDFPEQGRSQRMERAEQHPSDLVALCLHRCAEHVCLGQGEQGLSLLLVCPPPPTTALALSSRTRVRPGRVAGSGRARVGGISFHNMSSSLRPSSGQAHTNCPAHGCFVFWDEVSDRGRQCVPPCPTWPQRADTTHAA